MTDRLKIASWFAITAVVAMLFYGIGYQRGGNDEANRSMADRFGSSKSFRQIQEDIRAKHPNEEIEEPYAPAATQSLQPQPARPAESSR